MYKEYRGKQFVIGPVLCLLQLTANIGQAQTAAESSARAAESDACLRDAKCVELYEGARALSQAGQYDAARSTYQSAYDRSKAPWLLLNVGRMHQKAGYTQQAIDTYQRLLDDPVAQQDAEIQSKAREYLRQTEAAPAIPSSPPAPATPVYKKWWLWTVLGVVAAGTAAGIAGGVVARQNSEPPQSSLGNARVFTITIPQ